MKNIAVVIINWKGADDTIDCLKSFQDQTDKNGLHLIVIDNASDDDSNSKITNWAENEELSINVLDHSHETNELTQSKYLKNSNALKLTYICSDTNNGFCIANNIATKYGFENGADYVLILNNDTTVAPNLNKELQIELANDHGLTLFSPQIAYANDPDIVWWRGGKFSKYLSPTYVAQGKPTIINNSDRYASHWVSGCATLISSHIYKKLGLYDPIFFIWCE